MIEANENIDLVTMRRQQALGRAQESYQRAVSEGRLVVRSRQGGEAAGWGQPALPQPAPEVVLPAATAEVQPAKAPADPEVAWRHTRLAITAGLVMLLLVIWIWQKRAGR